MPIELVNKLTAENYELAFPELQLTDQEINIPKHFMGMLSQITPEAAEVYIKQGGNLLVPKQSKPTASAAAAKNKE